jgi:ParB family chromosome partitioning protein
MSDSTTPMSRPKGRSGLGRGLGALMGEMTREQPVGASEPTSQGVRMLPVG